MRFATSDIAEQFALPWADSEKKFDHDLSVYRYTKELEKHVDTLVKHIKETDDSDRRAWFMHALAVRILFQFIIDVWVHIYQSALTFPSKPSQSIPLSNEPSASDGTDKILEPTFRAELVRPGPVPTNSRVLKAFDKNNLPLLVPEDVEREIGGQLCGMNRSNSRKTPEDSSDKDELFDETFLQPLTITRKDDRDSLLKRSTVPARRPNNEWQRRPYVIALQRVFDLLVQYPELQEEFKEKLKVLYKATVHCPPGNTYNEFVSGTMDSEGRKNPGWLAFDDQGRILNMHERKGKNPGTEVRTKVRETSSWNPRNNKLKRLDQDLAFGMTPEEVVRERTIEQALRSVTPVIGPYGQFPKYYPFPDQHSGRRFGRNVVRLQSRSAPVQREAEDEIDDGSVNGSAGLQSPTRVLCFL